MELATSKSRRRCSMQLRDALATSTFVLEAPRSSAGGVSRVRSSLSTTCRASCSLLRESIQQFGWRNLLR